MGAAIGLLIAIALFATYAAVVFKLDLDDARRELRLECSLSKLRAGRIIELERENVELGAIATLRDRRAADVENENCEMLHTLKTIRGLLPIEVNLGEERDQS